ncbi:MAG: co-chaperone GroES [Ilumatobacteraceae bacterium]|nr:co-chaperone GroES [Ilumatobacteraceae bacterium]
MSESTETPTAVQADTAKQDTAKQDTAKQDTAKQDTAKQDTAKRDTAKQDNDKAAAQKLGVDKMAIQMLNDRLLVKIPDKDGERRSMGGILIPATAQVSKRLVWAEVVALGQNVRSCEVGDQVLFGPEDRYEVEVSGVDYIMLRERDIHAVAASRIDGHTGLYL